MIIFHHMRADLTVIFGLGYIVTMVILTTPHLLKKLNVETFGFILLGIRE